MTHRRVLRGLITGMGVWTTLWAVACSPELRGLSCTTDEDCATNEVCNLTRRQCQTIDADQGANTDGDLDADDLDGDDPDGDAAEMPSCSSVECDQNYFCSALQSTQMGCLAALTCVTDTYVAQQRTVTAPTIRIPEGLFLMGTSDDEFGVSAAEERPLHEVELGTYFIMEDEVTVESFRVCVETGDCSATNITTSEDDESCPYILGDSRPPDADEVPMACVNYFGAREFCTFIGGRLPTEAEWEKAARGGCELAGTVACETGPPDAERDHPSYPWGEDVVTPCTTVCFGCETSDCPTEASIDESPYGVRNMAGSRSEWTLDGWDGEAYSRPEPVACPLVEAEGCAESCTIVVRGGSAMTSEQADVRVSNRYPAGSTSGDPLLGFRCVIDVEDTGDRQPREASGGG